MLHVGCRHRLPCRNMCLASVQLSTVCVSLVSMSTIEGVSFGWGGICVEGSSLSGVMSWISGSDVGLNSVKG